MFGLRRQKRLIVNSFDDPEFGKVTVFRDPRALRLKVRIGADGLRATLPPSFSVDDLVSFINENRTAIRRKRITVRDHSVLVIDVEHPLRTLTFTTSFVEDNINFLRFRLVDGRLLIFYPAGADLRSETIQNKIKSGVKHFLRQEAKRVLPPRVSFLANKWGFQYNSLKIQSSQTRWGSCSASGNINLSLFLMLLPSSDLIDLVILHELCHTVHMNHSSRFWQLLDSVTEGRARQLRMELKNYRCSL